MSLGWFTLDHPLLYYCITLTESPLFEAGVIVMIIANCVVLALFEPTKAENEGRNQVGARIWQASVRERGYSSSQKEWVVGHLPRDVCLGSPCVDKPDPARACCQD